MHFSTIRRAAAAIALLAAVFVVQPAKAQIKFEFEGGDQLAIAYLESRGYTEVKILANEFFQVRVEACKDGVRYRFKVRIDGRIVDLKKIGSCGAITKQEVRRILREAGYRRIDISQQNDRYIAFGCKQSDRFRIVVSLRGEILRTKRVVEVDARYLAVS